MNSGRAMLRLLIALLTSSAIAGLSVAQTANQLLPPPRPVNEVAEPPLELVEFRNIPLTDAMRLLSQQSGLRIVPSEEAGKKSVSLFLQNVQPMVAVAAVSQAHGLIYRRDAETGIVRIYTAKENQRDLTAFREEQTEVFTLLYPNAVNVATAIKDLFGDRVQYTYGTNDDRIYDSLQNRLDRFDLFDSRSLGLGFPTNSGFGGFGGVGGFGGAGIGGFGGGLGSQGAFGGIANRGSTRGGGLSGGSRPSDALRDTRQAEAERRAIVPIDQRLQGLTPDEIQELEKSYTGNEQPDRTVLLELLRRRPATIYVTVVASNNQLVVRTSDPTILTQIRELVCRLDVPTPVVLLEVKVFQIDLRDGFTSLFDFQFTDGVTTAGGFNPGGVIPVERGFTTGNILPPPADLLPESARRFAPLAPGPVGSQNNPSNSLLFQFVSANFRARLQLLEDKHRITELASPLIMTANNEVSQIFTGTQEPITVGFSPGTIATNAVVGTVGAVTQPTPITTLQNIGTTLLITPNINADRTVTLRIHQENSTVIPNGGKIPLPNNIGGFSQVPVDVVRRQNLTGTIVAQDGLTIAVGGLIEEGVEDARQEVPVLGKIPYVGIFFRAQDTSRFRRELVLLIRPFVLTTPSESQAQSKSLIELLSIHPNIVTGDLSTMGTYTPPEVPRAYPPQNECENIFRTHTVLPKRY